MAAAPLREGLDAGEFEAGKPRRGLWLEEETTLSLWVRAKVAVNRFCSEVLDKATQHTSRL
jgi:hypothetical protein